MYSTLHVYFQFKENEINVKCFVTWLNNRANTTQPSAFLRSAWFYNPAVWWHACLGQSYIDANEFHFAMLINCFLSCRISFTVFVVSLPFLCTYRDDADYLILVIPDTFSYGDSALAAFVYLNIS